jgi:hypothetical protein
MQENLHVVVGYSNFQRWDSRKILFDKFANNILNQNVNLHVVECAYGDKPFEISSNTNFQVIHVRARSRVWIKENLWNIGVQHLPHNWKYVVGCDADIIFRRNTWTLDTAHKLEEYEIVYPWDTCLDLGPDGEVIEVHKSFGHQYWNDHQIKANGQIGYTFAHPGYALAMTRNAYVNLGGFLDVGALGASDHHMAFSLIGRADETMPGSINSNYKKLVKQWEARAEKHIQRKIGYTKGTIEHFWHGKKKDRKYVDRWQILTKNNFDPLEDIKSNEYGVHELAGNKPKLQLEIDRYFYQRNEDSNTQ